MYVQRPIYTPWNRRTHACRGPGRARKFSAHARRAHGVCAPHTAVNEIDDVGAKELADALKVNSTLIYLGLESACSGASALHGTAVCTLAWGVGRANLAIAARKPLSHGRMCPAKCRQ